MDWTDQFMVHLFSVAMFHLQQGRNPGFIAGTLLATVPGVTPEQVEIATETAVAAQAIGLAAQTLPPQQPIADALGGTTPPGPTVVVTGVAHYERPDGTAVFRTIQREFSWQATRAEIEAEMNIHAVNWSADYNDQFVDVTIEPNLLAPPEE